MADLINMLKHLPGLSSVGRRATKDQWDFEYRTGRWNYLHDLSELAHYSVIAGYCRHLKRGGSVLDVGCGEGILCEALDDTSCATYLGVDISTQAILSARARSTQPARGFVQADLHTFETAHRYDVIVFNESLYYSPAPAQVLKRYLAFLKPDGVFIVSMYLPRYAGAWDAVDRLFRIIDEVQIRNRSGTTWTCRVLGVREPA